MCVLLVCRRKEQGPFGCLPGVFKLSAIPFKDRNVMFITKSIIRRPVSKPKSVFYFRKKLYAASVGK